MPSKQQFLTNIKMKYYIKFAPYFYLLVAILFLFDAFSKYQANQTYWISIALASVAIVMFAFKRKFAKKFDNQSKK